MAGPSSDGQVALHVKGKVIGSRKGPFTKSTLERSVSGVLPCVSGELVRSGKLPATTFIRADVGFLASVSSKVSLEMRRLGVGLGTALVRAVVDDLLPLGPDALLLRLGHLGLGRAGGVGDRTHDRR